jgi:Putative Flp pilus-assembly TadE/G-like
MRRNQESGQTLVFVALGMVMIGAILGLAIDLGYMRYMKRRLQTAADSAAIAGAAEINYGDVTAAANADAASNGFTDGTNGVTVTVNNPPLAGPNQGKPGYVEVLISRIQPTFFIRIVPGGTTNSTVQARAVAYLGSAKGCIYGLQASGHITVHNGAVVDAQVCAIIDNHDLTIEAGAQVTASAIGVAGAVSGSATPAPQTGMIPASDPLAYLQTQNPGGCDLTNLIINSGIRILNQGVFCGGITITGSAAVTFNPGLYVIKPIGGLPAGLVINSSGNVSGDGVTFYNGAGSGPLSITSTGTVVLSAPTSGAYAGILMFQDPANTSPATVTGNSNSKFQGALYFPNAPLTLNNIGSLRPVCTIVVAGSLDINGNTNSFNGDFSLCSSSSPIKDAVLTE